MTDVSRISRGLSRVTRLWHAGNLNLVPRDQPGETRDTLAARPGPCAAEDVVDWVLQALRAVSLWPRQTPPVSDRTVTPASLLIDPMGGPHLLDAGVARVGTTGTRRDRAPIGVAGDAPPAQLDGVTAARSDRYALEMTKPQRLTNQHPVLYPAGQLPLMGQLPLSRGLARILAQATTVNRVPGSPARAPHGAPSRRVHVRVPSDVAERRGGRGCGRRPGVDTARRVSARYGGGAAAGYGGMGRGCGRSVGGQTPCAVWHAGLDSGLPSGCAAAPGGAGGRGQRPGGGRVLRPGPAVRAWAGCAMRRDGRPSRLGVTVRAPLHRRENQRPRWRHRRPSTYGDAG